MVGGNVVVVPVTGSMVVMVIGVVPGINVVVVSLGSIVVSVGSVVVSVGSVVVSGCWVVTGGLVVAGDCVVEVTGPRVVIGG